MADKVIINKSILTGIGNAIREKKGTTELIPSLNMESEIRSIQTGGGEDMLQQLINNKKSHSYLFAYYTGNNLDFIKNLDFTNVTNLSNGFQSLDNVTTIPLINIPNVTTLNSAFEYCKKLTTVEAIDVSNVVNLSYMFSSCPALKTVLMYGMKTTFQINSSTQFEREDLLTILNNLAAVTTTQTLYMGTTNLAKLTDEDKAIATNKNWTLA